MRISKSGKQGVSRKIWMRIQKNLDSAVNPARRPMFDSSLSHSFLLPQRNCASVGTARALGGYNKKSPTENLAAVERPRGHNPRAVVTGLKIYMRCARRTVPLGRKLAP
ncbi:MAG: hypothetical protein DMG11_27545 [Acidobacteria bacterium]|nr:MAG: hypothetical protein DMG11_27545 [Acidobacteriota bacterium]